MATPASDVSTTALPGLALPGRMLRRPRVAARPLLGALSVAAMVLAWWLLGRLGLVRADLVPPPSAVWAALVEVATDGYRGTTLWRQRRGHAGPAAGRVRAGHAGRRAAGAVDGVQPGRRARRSTGSLQFLRPLPPLSYMILLILWLGTGDLSKAMLLFLTAFPIIAAASAAGVRGVKRQRVQAARALGASGAAVFRHVILPSAAPMIMTGLQIALAAAFSTVVSAELLAATDGLGWMVISGSTFLRNDIIMLCILLLGGLGVLLAGAAARAGPAA